VRRIIAVAIAIFKWLLAVPCLWLFAGFVLKAWRANDDDDDDDDDDDMG